MDVGMHDGLPGGITAVSPHIEANYFAIQIGNIVPQIPQQILGIMSFLGGHCEIIRGMPERDYKCVVWRYGVFIFNSIYRAVFGDFLRYLGWIAEDAEISRRFLRNPKVGRILISLGPIAFRA
jgi:hypothetical protein